MRIINIDSLSKKVFSAGADVFGNSKQCDLVCETLTHIGKEVLASTKQLPDGSYKERWSEERIKTSALGYNDAQQVVVFESNIPTYSITALWANGEFAGKQWNGLFQRTEKS